MPFTELVFFSSVIAKQKGKLQKPEQMTRTRYVIFDGMRHTIFENIHYAGKRFDITTNDRKESKCFHSWHNMENRLQEFTY